MRLARWRQDGRDLDGAVVGDRLIELPDSATTSGGSSMKETACSSAGGGVAGVMNVRRSSSRVVVETVRPEPRLRSVADSRSTCT